MSAAAQVDHGSLGTRRRPSGLRREAPFVLICPGVRRLTAAARRHSMPLSRAGVGGARSGGACRSRGRPGGGEARE